MSMISLQPLLKQALRLSPQLFQSMNVLQMNSQELLEYLSGVLEENPVLDQQDDPALQATYRELCQEASWISGGTSGATFTHDSVDSELASIAAPESETLSSFLKDQLDRMHLENRVLALTKYMCELLDDDGFLVEEDIDGLRELAIPEPLIDESISVLQQLEPAGVGAKDVRECLLLQLRKCDNAGPVVEAIVSRFLTELGLKHYNSIAQKLNVSVEEIQKAERVIAQLNPYPGHSFTSSEPTVYIRPDIYILERDGMWQAILNEFYLPRISISNYYSNLLKKNTDDETKDYLKNKMQQAKWVLNSIKRRGSTLQNYADTLLEVQKKFFTGESDHLVPMRMSEMAERLGVHPSTISRTTHGKYLQCQRGTYPLRYFFSRPIGTDENVVSGQAVKLKIAELIRNEDPHKPLSDQKICDKLADENIKVARRTVAKYRLAMKLPSARQRKRE